MFFIIKLMPYCDYSFNNISFPSQASKISRIRSLTRRGRRHWQGPLGAAGERNSESGGPSLPGSASDSFKLTRLNFPGSLSLTIQATVGPGPPSGHGHSAGPPPPAGCRPGSHESATRDRHGGPRPSLSAVTPADRRLSYYLNL